MTPTELPRQLQQYVRMWELSGVEFVPRISTPDTMGNEHSAANTPPTISSDHRRVELTQLEAEVSQCDRCPELFATRTQTVFGVGPLSPKVFFLGDAPWELDDREGEPFRGEVGDLFDKILTVMGFGREEVYLCTSIKCRPPRNRPPRNEESSNCHGYLERQLELVSPEFLCCLGITAARAILGPEMNLDTIRGRVHEYRGIPVVCTVHPAYLLKNPEAKKECWEDLKLLLRTMGRPIPSKS